MGLFSRRKKIRTTYEAETLRNVFREDYKLYTSIEKSKDLKRYKELSAYVNSPVFKERRKKVEQLRYKDSEYYKAEKRYKKLLKSEKLHAYYIIRDSEELKGYLKVKESPLYEEYAKLRVIVKSSGFDKRLRPAEYKAYKEHSRNPKVRALERFEKNRKFRFYTEISGTKIPLEFEKLSAYIKSKEFQENREYLLNKKRYLTTDDYKLLCEYEALKRRSDLVRYFALCADDNFRDMSCWELVFSDDFNTGKLNTNHWITRYYAGERFLDDTYGVGKDVQLFTPENISFNESSVCLNFRKESLIGKYWDEKMGIREKSYAYTSGLISSAVFFRQRYGKFEAKIKLSHNNAVKQSFWLRGNTDVPHVQIMGKDLNGLQMGNVYASQGKVECNMQEVKNVKLTEDYYIFTLEWTRDKMVWMINDTVVKEVHENIPQVPMYVGFSLGTGKAPADKYLPTAMEIDWVRFYRQKN